MVSFYHALPGETVTKITLLKNLPKNFKESELFQIPRKGIDQPEKPCYHIKHIKHIK
jgi:hypothetical protein